MRTLRRVILAGAALVGLLTLLNNTRWVRGKYLEDGEGGHLEIGRKIDVHPINEWYQVRQIGKCNWYAFTLLYLYGEINSMAGNYELKVIVLGLGFYANFDYNQANSPIRKIADEAYEHIVAYERDSTDFYDIEPFGDQNW